MNNTLHTFKILLFTVFFGLQANSQIYYTDSKELEDVKAFYLGYENKISFNIFYGASNVRCTNATVTMKSIDSNSFIIQPTSTDSIELLWTSSYTDKNGNEASKEMVSKFPVAPLPKVDLCLGSVPSGSTIDVADLKLNYCYPSGTPSIIQAKLTPLKWILTIEGEKKNYSGSTETLSSEAIEAIKKAKSKKKITISTIATGNKVLNGTFYR